MKAIFLRALEEIDDKGGVLRETISSQGRAMGRTRFEVDPARFAQVPRSPFAYWVSDRVRGVFTELRPFQAEGRAAKQGLATADDFRFLRTWTEIATELTGVQWVPLAKGGKFSPFYSDLYLVVRWEMTPEEGHELKAFAESTPGTSHWSRRIASAEFYFRPGLTWPVRAGRFAPRALPAGCAFSHRGYSCFVPENEVMACLGLFNSSVFDFLFKMTLGRFGHPEFLVGILPYLPLPKVPLSELSSVAGLGRRAWSVQRSLDTCTESSHAFHLPALLQVNGNSVDRRATNWADHVFQVEEELAKLQREIDARCFALYGIDGADREQIERGLRGGVGGSGDDEGEETEEAEVAELNAAPLVASLFSWCVGVSFGRFDLRLATGKRSTPPEPDPFDPLPVCSPGMLTGEDGLPLEAPPAGYPIDFPGDGILVDDPGADRDLVARARQVFEPIFDDPAARWEEAAEILGDRDHTLRGWFAREFFELHIKRYSKSRRKAPIYWQLATPSASYSAWLYYHRNTRDTLFRLLNDHIAPKLQHEERKLTNLNQNAGGNPTASQRKEIDAQEIFVGELRAFRDEVARVAPLWNPNLNDGVILNFAPLWRLMPQNRTWQRECRKAWDKLCKGDHDWAHLAMHLWPERVVPKCAKDRSLAIAHGLEKVFWEEDQDGKWQQKSISEEEIATLVDVRASAAVRDALKSLHEAPAPTARRTRGRRSRKNKAVSTQLGRSR